MYIMPQLLLLLLSVFLRLFFFSVLFFSRPQSKGWPHHGRTFSIYPSSVILIDSFMENPVDVLCSGITPALVNLLKREPSGNNCSRCFTGWILFLLLSHQDSPCLQCFDAVGWAAGRASGL